ncbi:MAG TPA: CoA-binding protein [Candidatus Thermoplasmatota archaeon]|nr:CoA-binding protein [Candidatus Thermoplasmatota archaeon]
MDDPVSLLRASRRIAVVGCSATPGKDAHDIPKHLLARGYDVIPVNPSASEIFGLKAYRTLAEVPGPIDLVNVFRPASEAAAIARQAADVGAKGIWLQSGLRSPEAEAIAREHGLRYVEDSCVRVVSGYVAH